MSAGVLRERFWKGLSLRSPFSIPPSPRIVFALRTAQEITVHPSKPFRPNGCDSSPTSHRRKKTRHRPLRKSTDLCICPQRESTPMGGSTILTAKRAKRQWVPARASQFPGPNTADGRLSLAKTAAIAPWTLGIPCSELKEAGQKEFGTALLE